MSTILLECPEELSVALGKRPAEAAREVQLREIVLANIPFIMLSSYRKTRRGFSYEDIDSGTKRDRRGRG